MELRKQLNLNFILGMVAVLAFGVQFLALIDIGHGGEDLRLEWRIVQVASLIQLVFVCLTLFSLVRVLNEKK